MAGFLKLETSLIEDVSKDIASDLVYGLSGGSWAQGVVLLLGHHRRSMWDLRLGAGYTQSFPQSKRICLLQTLKTN